jgi:hypothetical protein
MVTKSILIGRIDITDNLDFVKEVLMNPDPNTILINLDEFNNSLNGPYTIQGVELLPPPEAVIAEQESDMEAYDFIYDAWYNQPELNLFVTGLIASLYQGKNILMYYPDLNPAESITIPKMLAIFWNKYGIGIGTLGVNNGTYRLNCTPLWLAMMYQCGVIGYVEFLVVFPDDAHIQGPEMNRLLLDIRPIGKNIQECVNDILRLQKRLKKNPLVKTVFYDESGKRGY